MYFSSENSKSLTLTDWSMGKFNTDKKKIKNKIIPKILLHFFFILYPFLLSKLILLDKISSVKTFCLVFKIILDVMDKLFCENLKALRKDSGKTQKQIADKLNVVESCYANWEQGRTEPNIESIKKLCAIFKVSADELLGLKEW